MMATFAKFFIVITIVFEIITLTVGPAFYPVLGAASAIILICIAAQYAVPRLNRFINRMIRSFRVAAFG